MDSRELISYLRDLSEELDRCAEDAEHSFDWPLADRGRRFLGSLADEIEDLPRLGLGYRPAAEIIEKVAKRTSRG